MNLKPLLPGHVLVCPQKLHKRLTDLSAPELTDLMQAVQRVQRMLARHYFTTPTPSFSGNESQPGKEGSNGGEKEGLPEDGSFNIAIQDGAEAGQTVPHLHVHVIPRIRGATAKSDDGPGDKIYEMMADEHGNVGGALWDRENGKGSGRPQPGGGFPRIEDADRQARSMQEMEEEARLFRDVLGRLEREGS